ncbi:MAG: hypothetical protein Kow0029_30950 [Candidatus Rifleibacteriota bacterium]
MSGSVKKKVHAVDYSPMRWLSSDIGPFLPVGLSKVVLLALVFIILINGNLQAAAWKLSKNFWSEEDEKIYENFVMKLGESKYTNLNKFIRDSKANPLYGEEDKKFYLYPDCADLPYLIRVYVAYKLRLPFSYVSSISGNGGDERYSNGNKPVDFRDQDYFSSPQKLFSQVTLVNSGFFRMSAKIDNSDHYPVKIQPESIKPGTIYYDPDGHVAIVSKVTPDGRIRVIDAHPDKTISKPWFGAKFTRGTPQNGGGFKRWRPLRYTSNGQIKRSSNHNIADYSDYDQYLKSYSYKGKSGLSFYQYVRARLASDSSRLNPVEDFRFMLSDLYEDICYRAVAVDICLQKGINKKPHPGSLPWNIYGTDGLWEEFSTPSRDARLKVAFRDFYERTRQMVLNAYAENPTRAFKLARELLAIYDATSPKLTVRYVDSLGKQNVLSFDDVTNRLFRFSFDPYHAAEFRWGAPDSELAASTDDQTKKRFYQLEARLRNQLERVYNQPTPLSMGPENPPEVNVKKWLTSFLQGNPLQDNLAATTIASPTCLFPPGQSPAEIQARKIADQKLALSIKEGIEKAKIHEFSEASSTVSVSRPGDFELPVRAGLKEFALDLSSLCDELAVSVVHAGESVSRQNLR